ncbi:MAG: heme ABC exporter ATP-binding protein CcmA [Anaerolineaceae bacterium]|nr:heme ABC exporter ATP-binding protein CcmA [Anaerolineaceae bacterium]
MRTQLMIETRRLVKRFGMKTVLRQIDLQIAQGEFVALLGPNGAGKTTLLRILASLARPSLGQVMIAGYSLPWQASAVRRKLGVVSHQPLLYGDLSAEDNLRFFGRLYGLAGLEARVTETLALVGLEHRRHELVRTFSRGMQQRLAIGRAVLHRPEVLLLDEPHTGLDQDACEMLEAVLRQVTRAGQTVLMTSHDLARAAALAGRFDVLVRGKIAASITSQDLPPDGLLAFYRQALENNEREAGKL